MAFPQIPQSVRQDTLDVLKLYLTEENAEVFIRVLTKAVKKKLPRWLRWLPIRRVMKALFPAIILEFFEDLLK